MEGNLLLLADRHPVERAADGSWDKRATKEKFAVCPRMSLGPSAARRLSLLGKASADGRR
jgi:hypothetical protein